MSDGTHLTTWVTRESKERFAAVARHQGLSDSALLKRLVDLMLQSASAAELGKPGGADRASRDSRLTVRIRPDDQMLLRERAAARGMAAATRFVGDVRPPGVVSQSRCRPIRAPEAIGPVCGCQRQVSAGPACPSA
jgi:hypothetical protein